jgi:hypothetical protein
VTVGDAEAAHQASAVVVALKMESELHATGKASLRRRPLPKVPWSRRTPW